MIPRIHLTAGLGLLLAALGSQASSQNLPGTPPDLSMPFDLVSGFEVVVQGQIGGLDGLRFILDTGSSYSTIDRRVADRIGLRRRPGTVFSFDRDLAVEWADVPEIRIGPMRATGMSMMVARLAGISPLADDADGIIGLDVLSRAEKITIDYEQKRVFLEMKEGGVEPSAIRLFVVPVVIQGLSMRMLVDTGLQYVLLYKERVRDALPHLRTVGEPRAAALGSLQATQVNLPGVRIFGPDAVTPVILIDGPRTAGLDGVDGYFGPASLHARRVELDFAARTLRWE
jgi:predicted aspartyl protease